MRRFLSLLVIFAFLAGGCAVLDSPSRINNLQDRLDAVESRQATIEDKLGMDSQPAAYVPDTDVDFAETTITAVSMSKKEIQAALQNAGYYNGPIDGKFGKLTRQAIMDFQKDKGLKVDGIAGTQTKKALIKYLN